MRKGSARTAVGRRRLTCLAQRTIIACGCPALLSDREELSRGCDLCQTAAGGYSFCNRPCTGDSECNGSICMGGICHQGCSGIGDTSCPGTCKRTVTGYNDFNFCDCSDACEIHVARRPVGTTCGVDDNCESGVCYSQCISYGGSGFSPGVSTCTGLCSKPCAQSSDCGDGLICANVPCVDTEACGAQCLPACNSQGKCDPGYSCRQLDELGADTATSVCDIKLPEMVRCQRAGQCQSGICFMDVCVSPGGDKNPNGGKCKSGTDCRSQNCIASACRGTALLGDACGVDPDCAVGTCCTSGPKSRTCAAACL